MRIRSVLALALPLHPPTALTVVALASLLGLGACGEDDARADSGADVASDGSGDASDAGPDAGDTSDVPGDSDAADAGDGSGDDAVGDSDAGDATDIGGVEPGTPVEVDFAEWFPEAAPGAGAVRAYRVEQASQLLSGMSVQGRVGDWVIENDEARFLIEDVDRTMSPCPYGGNVIDAVWLGPAGPAEETLGEVCVMINLGQTFRAKSVEILEDGTGGRALIAVTGDMATLDFLNIQAMAGGFLSGLSLDLALEPGRTRPVTITTYYALVPGTNALRTVTAFRNDGPDEEHLAIGHLLRPAGQGVFFNPLNRLGGYGYEGIGTDNIAATPVAFAAYTHASATWTYVPDVDPTLSAALPIGGGSLSVAGVTATLYGTLDLIAVLLAQRPSLPRLHAVMTLPPGASGVRGHHLVVGDGSLSTTIDTAYGLLGVETGTIAGVVRDGSGEPVAGALVTAVDSARRGLNQARSGADGRYAMQVPAERSVEVRAYARGRSGAADGLFVATAGSELQVDVPTGDPGFLEVRVRQPDGSPTVARLTVTCEGGCPRPLGAERDLIVDDFPRDFAALEPIGLDGTIRVPLEPGSYGVVVSRGMEWSIWPPDAPRTGGAFVNIVSGETVSVDAEIARVVDSAGALSADFHVHALGSSDSSVSNTDRVWNFATEGVDVIVSTDHDFIFDHAPVIAALGLDEELASFVGSEITTSSYGHINAFPLAVDEEHRTGGALDWGNGDELTLLPAETYAWAHAFEGEQVVQLNHPDGAGTIGALGADLLLGISTFPAEQLGLPPQPIDPNTGDTGFWSDDFTALEVMNGLSRGNFYARMRYWLTMLGRGFAPTATAVTDTHKLYGDLGGVPRTFVFVSDETDTPWTIDPDEFVRSVNAGRAIGTNGPFFRARARNAAGDTAGPGDTIAADAGLELVVEIDSPEWVRVDRIDLYVNVTEGIYSSTGAANSAPIPPTHTVEVGLSEDDLVVAETGTIAHRHWVKAVTIPLDIDEDAYVIVVVRGEGANTQTLWPVVPRRSETPFAFSNPIFVDADGGGYDTWPLQDLIDRLLAEKARGLRAAPTELPALDGFAPMTPMWMAELLHRISCQH